ncbi:hypothetical protein ACFO3O_05325 [Dokdonia ponticola]|uniref:Glycosyltransferase family 1 protein n=1 Tax=Dokdonia ponticola TaxID=2041041 RepID=A0ABV9HVH9_9FLAO
MKTIIVNASAAKTGGAETILRTFVQEASTYINFNFILLTSVEFEKLPKHIKIIDVNTSGLNTLFFSTIGIYKYVKKYKPSKILSFSNINYILSPLKGVTYFHQFKALEDGHTDIKVKIYRFLIMTFLKRNTFILQSEYIKSIFESRFKISKKNTISVWPGFLEPQPSINKSIHDEVIKCKSSYKGLLPIAYDTQHKNIDLIRNLIDFFDENNIVIHSLLSNTTENEHTIVHHGTVDRSVLFELYEIVDFLVFPSKSETVGLPIFEFLQTGKPAFVYAADYAIYFHKQFNKPENLILFKDEEDFKRLFLQKINTEATKKDYSKGEWDKIFKLL